MSLNVFKLNCLLLIASSFISTFCSKQEVCINENNSEETLVATRSDIINPIIENDNHSISLLEVENHLNNKFEKKQKKSLQIITEDDSCLLYIVNFEKGWAIVSGDDRADNIILAYCEEGAFNPDNIDNPEVSYWYDLTKAYIKSIKSIKTGNSLTTSTIPKRLLSRDDEPYYWLKILISDNNSYDTQGTSHLLNTKWGQLSPWNYKCPPEDNPNHYPSGCISVAISQTLYYLNQHFGYPTGLYHDIIPSYAQSGSTYYFSSIYRGSYNSDSPRWDYMPWTRNGNYTNYVGDLMVDIGERVNMIYTPTNSGITSPLTPVYNTFSQFGVGATSGSYSYDNVKSSIDAYKPVVVIASVTQPFTGNHVWVIDGYIQETTINTKTYQWRMVASDSLSYYNPAEICTEAQMQLLHPNIQEYDYEYSQSSYTSKYLLMNWGYDHSTESASYDNGLYSFYSSGWSSSTPSILYNFYNLNNN